ncbi:hypothetical protein DITRI_Ditri19aG0059000 [Diplodiscus trichospermus]
MATYANSISLHSLVLIDSAIMAMIMAKLSIRAQLAYAEAESIVEQTIEAIKTVSSYVETVEAIRTNYFFGVASGKLIQRIQSLIVEKVVHQDISWCDDLANSSGTIGATLFIDASTVKNLIGDTMALIVQNISTVAIGLIIAFTTNWMLALAILAEKCETPKKLGVCLGLISSFGFGFFFFALYCTNAFCYYIGAILVNNGKAAFEEVFKVFFALRILAIVVSQNNVFASDTNKLAKDSIVSTFEILDGEPTIDSSSNAYSTLPSVTGNIELELVSFKYPIQLDIQIFRNLCLNIPFEKVLTIPFQLQYQTLLKSSFA